VNHSLAKEIRAVCLTRGFDASDFTLIPFGGAGQLHACAVAEELTVARVLLPNAAGVLSALGASLVILCITLFGMGAGPQAVGILNDALAPALGEEAVRKGAKLVTSSWRRFPGDVMPGKAKAGGNYVNSALAKMDALAAGADEALLLDKEGYVAEGSGENLFYVKGGVIYAIEHSVNLPGITRDSVIEIAEDLGYTVKEAYRVTREVLFTAEEVFMTGTAAEVTPVSMIDNRPIGSGSAGELTMKLRREYLEAVTGKKPEYRKWLTFVG